MHRRSRNQLTSGDGTKGTRWRGQTTLRGADRELQALGHMVRLMPPCYVKAYLKRGKNDANDAAAICEAVTRLSMRFVPIKTKG